MSHIVTIQAKIKDPTAVAAACHRLTLRPPAEGTTHLYSGEVSGLMVQLPGWQYPIVIDTQSGSLRYDNYGGCWGERAQLDRFLQMYVVEKAKLEARCKGLQTTESVLQDGSIKVQIMEGA
jgi:hypothetical protein